MFSNLTNNANVAFDDGPGMLGAARFVLARISIQRTVADLHMIGAIQTSRL